jgi:hypothetical protein
VAAASGNDNRNNLFAVDSAVERIASSTRGALLAGAAGALACGYVALVNPSRPGRLPSIPCPFHAATGLWCPGCGMTRAFHAVLTGHPVAAFGHNLLWPLVVVIAGWLWLSRLSPRIPKLTRAPTLLWVVLIIAAGAFGVARNVPALSALAP